MKWYYYLHTNGDLINKHPVVVENDPQYFDSPFVKKYWLINTENRLDAWILILEALALGCQINRIKDLTEKWKLTFEDLKIMLKMHTQPTDLQKEGLEIFIEKILNIQSTTLENKA